MHVSLVSKLIKADTPNTASARVPPFLVLSDFSPHSKARRALLPSAPPLHDLISMTLMKGRGLLEELDGLIGLLREGKKAESAGRGWTRCTRGVDQSCNWCQLLPLATRSPWWFVPFWKVARKKINILTCRRSGGCALMKGRSLTSHFPGNSPSDHASLGSAQTGGRKSE